MAEPAPDQSIVQPGPSLIRTEAAELWGLSWPVVVSRLGIMTMGLSDAIVVGRYSATELGYHALAWAPTSVVVTMAVGLLTGVQVMTARALGAERPQLSSPRTRYTYYPGGAEVPESAAPNIRNRSYTIAAEVDVDFAGAFGSKGDDIDARRAGPG